MFVRVSNLQNVDFLTIWCQFDENVQTSHPNVSKTVNKFLQEIISSWIFVA